MSPALSSAPGHPLPSAGLPASTPARRWMITTTDGESRAGYLPTWATHDPSEQGVSPEELAVRLADINHHVGFPGQILRVYSPANPDGQPTPVEVLHASIDCNPHAPDPELRIPVANLHLAGEYWLTDLGPEELVHLAKGLRTLADRLADDVVPILAAARDDWHAHHLADAPAPGCL